MIKAAHGRGWKFWGLQAPGCLLLLYLVTAQGLTAISYDLWALWALVTLVLQSLRHGGNPPGRSQLRKRPFLEDQS